MASTRDTIVSQIPNHINENHPRFVDFLKAYYEWVSRDDSPYELIKNHMSYLDFTKSMDEYVDYMKTEYLNDVPDSVLLDKEMFIKWSRKFNIARGSHASYKFLFRLLFDEQHASIYLPKENILKTSDGEWISDESRMYVSCVSDISTFNFGILTQERVINEFLTEYAYATIQSATRVYNGRYKMIELRISDVDGEFEVDYPVTTDAGGDGWIVPTVHKCVVDNKGDNHQIGERIVIEGLGPYTVQHPPTMDGVYDTHIITRFNGKELTVTVDGEPITDYEYTGRYIRHPSILPGSDVTVQMPSYSGYMSIDSVTPGGKIETIEMHSPPVGTTSSEYSITNDGYGVGFEGRAIRGAYSLINGYYRNTKGQLSSDMHIQDSLYYQDYSYVIRTKQDIDSYGDIVKQALHPTGFAMFGMVNMISVVEDIIMELMETEEKVIPTRLDHMAAYPLGPNYSFVDKIIKGNILNQRLYRMGHFKGGYTRDFYVAPGFLEEQYVKQPYPVRYGYETEQSVGTEGFLEDNGLEKLPDTPYNERKSGLDLLDFDNLTRDIEHPSWVTKNNLVDSHLYVFQDYSSENESGWQYFETGYVTSGQPDVGDFDVSPYEIDDLNLIDTTINETWAERKIYLPWDYVLIDQIINDQWPTPLTDPFYGSELSILDFAININRT